MKISIKAKSSSGGGLYNVDFNNENDKITVFCDCPAGIHGKFCKHKWQLMNGNLKMLADESEANMLEQIGEWIAKSSFNNLYSKVNELEIEFAKIKKQISQEKKNVERKFREGF